MRNDCTEGRLKILMGSEKPCKGVYLFSRYSTGENVYVGKSGNLQQRVGSDHRNNRSGSLIPKIKNDDEIPDATNIESAKLLFHQDFYVRWVFIHEIDLRSVFEVYAITSFKTKYNKEFLDDD